MKFFQNPKACLFDPGIRPVVHLRATPEDRPDPPARGPSAALPAATRRGLATTGRPWAEVVSAPGRAR